MLPRLEMLNILAGLNDTNSGILSREITPWSNNASMFIRENCTEGIPDAAVKAPPCLRLKGCGA